MNKRSKRIIGATAKVANDLKEGILRGGFFYSNGRKRKINGAVVSREFKDGKWENFFILNGTIYGGKTLVSDVEY